MQAHPMIFILLAAALAASLGFGLRALLRGRTEEKQPDTQDDFVAALCRARVRMETMNHD